jgi:Mce-associated membrane protein
MDAVTQRVLEGATGDFRREYAAGRDRLVASVEQREARVEASLRALGLVEESASAAVVVVAADSRLVDRGTGDEAVEQRDRLRVGLERVDGRWKVARLEYVR